MNISKKFLNSIKSISKKKIPEAVMVRAKQSLLDYFAVTSAGVKFQEEKINHYFTFAIPENGDFIGIGINKRLALKEAVFLNGLNSHALDFDDGTNSGIIHLGSPIFSLLLPLAQRYDMKIDDMLKAAIIGYEASYTMAVSIQPGHKVLGYHATGTCGVLGAAIAASYMLDFTEAERFQVFATACVSATGMLKVLDDGSELKPYNVAKAALLALTSIQMAKAGFKGHPDPLGGNRGYLKMMTGKEDVELKPVLLNGTYAIQKSYTKPYASCRYTHPSVEAAILLRNKYGLTAEEVERIDIKTYSLAVAGHDHTDIPGSYSAKMSIPYSTAAGLIYGRAGLQEFSEEKVKNSSILELTKKVHVVSDKELSDVFPGIQAAIVEITTKNGIISKRVDFPKGEPENPLSDEEFRLRYDELMDYANMDRAASGVAFNAVYQEEMTVRNLLKLFEQAGGL
ncbi:MmgE/PrpD family protein [Eubacterium callanderi]|uniref:MmgE/PrpD family protein n=1 Tax=Eubacterium callanderi TaxID=53442 RepID=UPI00283BC03C|nr:MmgE/PrpD family protein [Eubacterium sp.]